MHAKTLEDIEANFNDYEVGLERYVRCAWALDMRMHHVFRPDLTNSLISNIERINESLGVAVKTIDLNQWKQNFTSSGKLNKSIEENEYPTWLWLYGVEALKDPNFSGWLRNRLTARSIENLRVIFVVDSYDDYREVFCDRKAAFYHSTRVLQTNLSNQNENCSA